AVHVAGTKGKGSVCALLESSLRRAGYRTGLYTSPHLVRFGERIRVNGEEIGEADLIERVDELRPWVAQVPGLTTYEIVTALAFRHFALQEVDAAVVEVGLGGRLDATNVLTPRVAVITSLSYDHMHLLGDRLSDIAREKAGIIKPGVPVVAAPQQSEAEKVIRRIAAEQGAPLITVGKDWHYAPGTHDLQGQTLYIWSASEQSQMDAFVESAGAVEWAPPRFEIPLLGHHQVVNAAVAYATLQAARRGGLEVPETAIREGFRTVVWPGRFQVLSAAPAVVVDSAHNRDSALKLRIALDDYFPGRPVSLIFGASEDKDIAGMLIELLPRARRLIVTQAVHPRAADPEALAEMAREFGHRVEVEVPVQRALERALESARPEEVIVAAGSLFIAGEVLAAWQATRMALPEREEQR
ncbi:MAG: bifunctional folylpolyglutamate synthase/dihydrofolate synthase, partial [Anaerolineales bacterium]